MSSLLHYIDIIGHALDIVEDEESPEADYLTLILRMLNNIRFETEDVEVKDPEKLGTTIALQRIPGLDLLVRVYT